MQTIEPSPIEQLGSPASALPIIISKIHFGKIIIDGYESVHVAEISARVLLLSQNLRIVFSANPTTTELLKFFLLKFVLRRKFHVAVFDLILRRPTNTIEWLIGRLKALALKSVDLFLLIHKDTSGYELYYGIDRRRCRYVPFKANNLAFVDQIESVDGDYVVSCGASHRDFDTLLQAVYPLGYKTVIILSERAARLHNARLNESLVNDCVERLHDVDDMLSFNEIIARSRLVVVPIIAGTLQPAGISVYLEAMTLRKPVIATRGSSTEGILDERLAMLVPPGDPVALREAIKELWNDESRRRELGEAGQSFARRLGGNERLVGDITRHLAALCAESS